MKTITIFESKEGLECIDGICTEIESGVVRSVKNDIYDIIMFWDYEGAMDLIKKLFTFSWLWSKNQ